MRGLSASYSQQLRNRFVDWAKARAGIVGTFPSAKLLSVFDGSAEEVLQSGIDTEPRRFLYVAARLLMPDMTAAQYIQAMDVIFGPDAEAQALERLLELRAQRK
jgi:hypothetical protein